MELKKKALKPTYTVGQILKARRSELKLSVKDIEATTQIRPHYLAALESGKYDVLPSEAYARGILKNYSKALRLNADQLLSIYKRERELLTPVAEDARHPKTPLRNSRWVITPRTLVVGSFILLGALIGFYLIYQLYAFLSAPKLDITSPKADEVSLERDTSIIIAGRTDPGSDVYINDYLIRAGSSGEFSESVTLKDGTNLIAITAANKFGKKSTRLKKISTHIDRSTQPSAPDQRLVPISGIDLTVKVSGRSWLEIYIDDKPVFEGKGSIFEAGATQTYHASKKIELKVGNAGVTSVIISNEKIRDKGIGPLGKEGQVLSVTYTFDQSF